MENIKTRIKENLKTPHDFRYLHKRNEDLLKDIIDYTDFLRHDERLVVRVFCILNDIKEPPLCYCGNKLEWDGKNKQDFKTFCSTKCASNSNNTKMKIKQTNIKRYGSEYYLKSDEGRKNIHNVIKNKYGVDNISHLRLSNINEKLSKIRNKDWLYKEHIENKKSLKQISIELGVSNTTVKKYLNKYNINQKYYNNSSFKEKQLLKFIKQVYGGTIIENDRTLIPPLEIDILLSDINVAIEFCGLYWHSEIHKDRQYHSNKREILSQKKGIRLLTIFEDEWDNKKEIVKNKITNIIGRDKSSTIFARKCIVREVGNTLAKEFYTNNHIQGHIDSSIILGLFDQETLVACISFKKMENEIYNLTRFATAKNVPGGFSKLLSHFVKNIKWKKIYTFADLRWSNGDLYIKTGFTVDSLLKPDYSYIVGNDRKHKFGYRHKLLRSKLKTYDNEKTEHENCFENKIYRIYDCGKIRFLLENNK